MPKPKYPHKSSAMTDERRGFNPSKNLDVRKQLEDLFVKTSPAQPGPQEANRMAIAESIQKGSGPSVSFKRPRLRVKPTAQQAVMLVNLKQLVSLLGGVEKFSEQVYLSEDKIKAIFKGEANLDDALVAHIELSTERPGFLTKGLDEGLETEESDADLDARSNGQIPSGTIVGQTIDPVSKTVKTSYVENNRVVRRTQLLKEAPALPSKNGSKSKSKQAKGNTMTDQVQLSAQTERRIYNLESMLTGRGMKSKLCKAMGYQDSFLAFIRTGKTSFTDEIAYRMEKLVGVPEGSLDKDHPTVTNEDAVKARLNRAVELASALGIGVDNRKEVVEQVISSLDSAMANRNVPMPAQSVPASTGAKRGRPAGVPNKTTSASQELVFTLGGSTPAPAEQTISRVAPAPISETPAPREVAAAPAKPAPATQTTLVAPSAKSATTSSAGLNVSLAQLQAAYLRDLANAIESGEIGAEQTRRIATALLSVS